MPKRWQWDDIWEELDSRKRSHWNFIYDIWPEWKMCNILSKCSQLDSGGHSDIMSSIMGEGGIRQQENTSTKLLLNCKNSFSFQ